MLPPIKLSSKATNEFWEIPILFEDEALLALDKPGRLHVSPVRHDPDRPNLMGLLHDGIRRGVAWAKARDLGYLTNVHRLEFATSGVLLLARTKAALITVANEFGAGQPHSRYLVLAQGEPPETEFEVDAKLSPHPHEPELFHVDPRNGKRARTQFKVVERFRGFTLLQAVPFTARPQQIRAHLRHRGLPIVGDALYGGRPLWLSRLKPRYRFKADREELPLIGRVALHAEQLALKQPTSGAELTITSPVPKDFTVALKFLRRYAPMGIAPNLRPTATEAPDDDARGGS